MCKIYVDYVHASYKGDDVFIMYIMVCFFSPVQTVWNYMQASCVAFPQDLPATQATTRKPWVLTIRPWDAIFDAVVERYSLIYFV